MKNKIWQLAGYVVLMPLAAVAATPACPDALLTTYINAGNPYLCTESGGIDIGFNENPLLSYAGLSLLSSNNSAADPSSITVIPGASSLDFLSGAFSESSLLLSAQTELVQFDVTSPDPLLTTNFTLDNPSVSTGTLGVGTGIAVGQELVCVGGDFTSLPTGLVTTIANGVLGTGNFGCGGTVIVGTAASAAGLLSAVTGLVGLPDLTGLTDQASLQLAPYNADRIDVIKIQTLLSITGGSASTTGFGDSFAETPEPGTGALMLGLALAALVGKAARS